MTQNFQFDTKLDDRSKIINLWPTPVYQTSMPRKLNFLEINFLNKQHNDLI